MNRLGELVQKHIEEGPPRKSKRDSVAARYFTARKQREELEAQVQKLKEQETESAEELVLHNGRNPVAWGTDLYDACCSHGTVYYIKRQRHAAGTSKKK